MASTVTIDEMKTELRRIACNINNDLLSTLMIYMSLSVELVNKFKTAELFFLDQLLNNELHPWIIAGWLKTLGHTELAIEFETFAKNYNFPKDTTPNNPEIAIMQLLKYLKSELTQQELFAMRNSNSETFEEIFRDFVDSLTPSLTELKTILQNEDREDLAQTITTVYSPIIATMDPVLFKRTVTLCLDTLDTDIFSLLSALREALSKEYSTYRTLSIDSKKYSLDTDFIPLTFTAEVDTNTLPLTEGSDAELRTLMKYSNIKQDKKQTQTGYINAHTEIYSSSLIGKLISLIGHPGTGKTFYCKKLMNDYVTLANESFRFVFLVACRDPRWHKLEEKYIAEPVKITKMFLQMIIPEFPKCEELVQIIIRTGGNGLLLIIDSFDEFPQTYNFRATFLYTILKRQVLTRSTILITSRPGAWNQLLRGYGSDLSFDQSWQLLGFSPEQRNKFISTTLSSGKAFTCRKFLQTHPELNILCLVPVNISLLTGLIDNTTLLSNIHTLTDLYMSLVLFTLDNELKRIDKHSTAITSLKDLPADMLAQFNTLAELAYQGLIRRQITFSPAEFSYIATFSPKFAKGLGLFHIIPVITTHLNTIDYLSCPHLTLQEFLSAWHLAQKSPTEIASIVQQTFSDNTWPAMKMCIRFLCGILTQGHSSIISIIIDKLHRTSAPLLDCKKYLFGDYTNPFLNSSSCVDYTKLHYDNTESHLSVLPYVIETQQTSIIASYYKLLCPANTSIPHFYLKESITPVDIYSLTQFFTLLPPNSTISVLLIDIELLNSIQLDMLANSINVTCIDTLLVIFAQHYYVPTLRSDTKNRYIEEIRYEIQQLHITADNMSTLLAEYNRIITNHSSNIYDIYNLLYVLSLFHLPITVSNSDIQRDNALIQKLISFIRNINNVSCLHIPNQIYYHFDYVSFTEATIINTLIDSISTNATYVRLYECYFTPQFITTLLTSLHKLEYLYIDGDVIKRLRSLLKQPTINALTFQILNERNMKGLYLDNVTLQDDSILNDYLQSQTTLLEIHLYKTTDIDIHLYNTTDNTLATLHAILHLSSLRYLNIQANDKYVQSIEKSALLTILYRNRHSLSYFHSTPYTRNLGVQYTDIMSIFSQCPNLQYIDLSLYYLKPHDMHTLASTINQLHALLCINMYHNNDITDKGIKKLTKALATHNTVIWINLSNCGLTSVPVIISLINKFPCLQKIKLDSYFKDKSKLKMFAKQRKIIVNFSKF